MKTRRFALSLIFASLLATPLLATTVAQLTLDDIVAESDTIVVGTVESMQPRWIDRVLVTEVVVSTSRWIEGSGAKTVTVSLPGGADFDRKFPVAMTYAGAPTMAPGEEVVLFLTSDAELGLVVTGFSQGKYSVSVQGGEKVVTRDLTGTVLTRGTGAAQGGPEVAMALSTFISNIEKTVASAKKSAR